MMPRLTRRKLLSLLSLTPLAIIACAGDRLATGGQEATPEGASASPTTAAEAPSPPAPTPEPPLVLPAGEGRLLLMAGTVYETPLYVFGSGRPGKTALVLGGVHGNEPGGWLAADRVVQQLRPENGALLVVPRANRVAINLLERTTEALADLNRSYPGFDDGRPMERMATEIVNAIREFRVDLVHDMHESWAFYKDRTTNGTAFLGETVATNGEQGVTLVKTVIERVNAAVLYEHEKFWFRDFGQPQQSQAGADLPRQADIPPPGRGTSSLGLNRFFPGLITVLVEMGQQQALERRIALHIQVLTEVLRETGIGTA
jgi:hypothetical protein